jgi:hypothetical protein
MAFSKAKEDIMPYPVNSFRKARVQNRKKRQARHFISRENMKDTSGKRRAKMERRERFIF